MQTVYIDATQPLRWGPHPPVGITRVEAAFIRCALRQTEVPIAFFVVDNAGRSRMLNAYEQRYLTNLVDGSATEVGNKDNKPFLARLMLVWRAIRSGASMSGAGFNRVAALYISASNNRRGFAYQCAKIGIKLAKKAARTQTAASASTFDPIADPAATCYLSFDGLRDIATKRTPTTVLAQMATIVHDVIPIEMPDLADHGHAQKFMRDMNWTITHCRKLICVSSDTAQSVRAYAARYSLTKPPVIISNPLGSFLKEALRGKQTKPVPELIGRSFAFYCSTIEVRKNHILLLRLWKRLIPELGSRLPTLVLCGRWGWRVDEVKRFLEKNPSVNEKVMFLTQVGDQQLAWLYEHACFGLYPSFAEGWGLGASESMDFGLPVLISDAPSLVEATQNLMPTAPARDESAWYHLVFKACTDEAWLQELRRTIKNQYVPVTEETFAQRLLMLIAGQPTIAKKVL